jgi:hypothetical protein
MRSVKFGKVRQPSARPSLNAGLHYEGFTVEDWALADVAPDTIPVVLTLGAKPYDYDVRLGGEASN